MTKPEPEFWAWPFAAPSPDYEAVPYAMCAPDVDEMDLPYQEGMTLGDIKQSAFEAHYRMWNTPAWAEHAEEWAREAVDAVVGAWVIPARINGKPLWELVGDMLDPPAWGDSGDDLRRQMLSQVLRFLSVAEIR